MLATRPLGEATHPQVNPAPPDSLMMQDHFTELKEGAAAATKEAMMVADVIVHEWVYKHGTSFNLHSDRGTEFTAAMQ